MSDEKILKNRNILEELKSALEHSRCDEIKRLELFLPESCVYRKITF